MLIKDFNTLKKLVRPVRVYNVNAFRPVKGFSIDSRSIKKDEAFIALEGRYKDGHRFIKEAVKKGASLVISQKDIPNKPKVAFCLVADSYQAMGEIASYVIERKKPFVYGITGSLGKTTAKDMLAYLLEDKFKVLKNYQTENNFLGLGKTVFSLKNENTLVMELGTNRPGEIKRLAEIIRPDVGMIIFIKPVHLEGLKNLRGIFEEKVSLLKIDPKMKAVLNRDDPYLRKINFCKQAYWFGKKSKVYRSANYLYAHPIKLDLKESIFRIQDKFTLRLRTPFPGFIYSALAAICAAKLSNIPLKELVEKMNDFNNFAFGRAKIKRLGGFTILNDAYNANPYSFEEALKVVNRFPQKKVAVIGDMLELGDKSIYYHRLLAKEVAKSNFDYVLTIGDHTPYLVKQLKELGQRRAFHFSSHKTIAQFIKKKTKKTSLIFLKGSRKMELEKVITALK